MRIEGLGIWALLTLPGCYEGETGMEPAAGSTGEAPTTVASSDDEGEDSPSTTDAPGDEGETGEGATTGGPSDDDDGDETGGEETGEAETTGGEAPMGVYGVYEEIDGIVAVEAEHAIEIDDNGTERSWYTFSSEDEPMIEPDPDPPHWDSASGGACLEGLPDTRVTHDDQLQGGVNFYGSPGDGPILRYRVWFNTPGRYWVRVRAYSTGSEDNGVHVGIDGEWPASGARVQWCSGKNKWTWSGAQRTDANHCGEANMIFIDVDEAGEHEIAFSMREDGFEMDKWMLTNDPEVFPDGTGPEEVPFEG